MRVCVCVSVCKCVGVWVCTSNEMAPIECVDIKVHRLEATRTAPSLRVDPFVSIDFECCFIEIDDFLGVSVCVCVCVCVCR